MPRHGKNKSLLHPWNSPRAAEGKVADCPHILKEGEGGSGRKKLQREKAGEKQKERGGRGEGRKIGDNRKEDDEKVSRKGGERKDE